MYEPKYLKGLNSEVRAPSAATGDRLGVVVSRLCWAGGCEEEGKGRKEGTNMDEKSC